MTAIEYYLNNFYGFLKCKVCRIIFIKILFQVEHSKNISIELVQATCEITEKKTNKKSRLAGRKLTI